MSLRMMDAATISRFDVISAKLAAGGGGLNLRQIGDAAALAEELEKPEPDAERVEGLRARLGLESVDAA